MSKQIFRENENFKRKNNFSGGYCYVIADNDDFLFIFLFFPGKLGFLSFKVRQKYIHTHTYKIRGTRRKNT